MRRRELRCDNEIKTRAEKTGRVHLEHLECRLQRLLAGVFR